MSCADVLIYSNLLMIAINVIAMKHSPFIGLSLAMLCLIIGIAFILSGKSNREIAEALFISENKIPGSTGLSLLGWEAFSICGCILLMVLLHGQLLKLSKTGIFKE